MKIDTNKIKSLDRAWYEIRDSMPLSRYNVPLNRSEERLKIQTAYQKSQKYNPIFVYREIPELPKTSIYDFLRQLRPEDSTLEGIYFDKAIRFLQVISAIESHSPRIITSNTCATYGLPDLLLVNRAWEILKKDSDQSVIDENETGITTEEATLVFENLLKELRLESWGVIVEPHMNAKILVNNTKKQIKLRSDVSWSKTMIKRLGVHEVGTHLLRHHNGSKQFLKMFSRGWPGYLSTEEGLAVYNEDKMNLLSEDTLRKYASRVIAAYLALNYSFWEVFITLVEYIGWEEAFEVTVRAKRGFVDTSSYGTHLKDTSYLKGWIKVKQHLKNYPEDYKLLYIGKIGLEHLDLIKDWLAHGLITDESLLYPKSVVLDSEYFA